ncbi:hypothetical protein BT96DRAFT_1010590, partial [Gymnopus androsaceus JB14]
MIPDEPSANHEKVPSDDEDAWEDIDMDVNVEDVSMDADVESDDEGDDDHPQLSQEKRYTLPNRGKVTMEEVPEFEDEELYLEEELARVDGQFLPRRTPNGCGAPPLNSGGLPAHSIPPERAAQAQEGVPGSPEGQGGNINPEDLTWMVNEVNELISNNVRTREMKAHFTRFLQDHRHDPHHVLVTVSAYIQSSNNRGSQGGNKSQPVDDETDATPKKKGGPRTKDHNDLHRDVRAALASIIQPNDEKLAARSLKQWELTDFKDGKLEGPSLANFRLDLETKHATWTPWNLAACKVFIPHFQSLPGNQKHGENAVRRAFRTHLQQLKRNFVIEREGQSSTRVSQIRKNRRIARRVRLLKRRLDAFNKLRKLYGDQIPKELEEAITRLTWEIMSGDETDPQNRGQFGTTSLEWRSTEL